MASELSNVLSAHQHCPTCGSGLTKNGPQFVCGDMEFHILVINGTAKPIEHRRPTKLTFKGHELPDGTLVSNMLQSRRRESVRQRVVFTFPQVEHFRHRSGRTFIHDLDSNFR